jgi:Fe-S oxidoreductase
LTSIRNEKIILFCDEFTDNYDMNIGVKAIEVLNHYKIGVLIPNHKSSGRALISKGYMDEVMDLAKYNTSLLSSVEYKRYKVVGIEPSAILTLKDEYPRLLRTEAAEELATRSFMVDEFIFNKIQEGHLKPEFKQKISQKILFHGHCHQKALADVNASLFLLSALGKKEVALIPSGCCGMAGSFGYMKSTFDTSNQIAELVLFPEVRKNKEAIIVANGTSCRHQLSDGIDKPSYHLIEVIHHGLELSELG